MNRFFRLNPKKYESIRSEMDSESGFPSAKADTWFLPSNKAPHDSNGLCLIAAIPEISARFEEENIEEITEEEYLSSLPAFEL
ncbi:MAG: hypothetical protein ACK5DE_07930 [Bacteroidota bacterium]|jgi:hypothetical protein